MCLILLFPLFHDLNMNKKIKDVFLTIHFLYTSDICAFILHFRLKLRVINHLCIKVSIVYLKWVIITSLYGYDSYLSFKLIFPHKIYYDCESQTLYISRKVAKNVSNDKCYKKRLKINSTLYSFKERRKSPREIMTKEKDVNLPTHMICKDSIPTSE